MLILTITGEAALRDTLRSALGESSCQFLAPVPAEEVAATVRRVGPDAVLWDAGSAPLAGAPALAGLLKADPAPPPVLLLAPPADRDEAMQAVRAGVYDFLTTPCIWTNWPSGSGGSRKSTTCAGKRRSSGIHSRRKPSGP